MGLPIEIKQVLTVILTLLGGLWVLVLFIKIARAREHRPPSLTPSFRRLGQYPPQAPCPCGRRSEGATYATCCRPTDLRDLEEDIQQFIWRYWTHRSYAGRRRSHSMRHRLEDFPLPPLMLPEWVVRPENFTFPINETILRSWNPLHHSQQTAPVPQEDSNPADIL